VRWKATHHEQTTAGTDTQYTFEPNLTAKGLPELVREFDRILGPGRIEAWVEERLARGVMR